MSITVVITGAGWDPVEEVRTRARGFDIPERTPEMFWPVGDGATVLSRQVAQFTRLGAKLVFVGTGEPGCSPALTEDHDKKVYGAEVPNYGRSPWTEAQLSYICWLGAIPILMPDPHGRRKNCWTTLLRMEKAILAADWDRIVISAGDYVFRTSFLESLVENAKWPSQFWFWAQHSTEFLDRKGFVRFTEYLKNVHTLTQSRVWLERNHQCCGAHGIPQSVWGTRKDVFDWMMKDWMEVSYHSWKAILELAKENPV